MLPSGRFAHERLSLNFEVKDCSLLLSSAEYASNLQKSPRNKSGVMSSKIRIESQSPLKTLRATLQKKKSAPAHSNIRRSHTSNISNLNGILKSSRSSSSSRKKNASLDKRSNRSVSFSKILERVHFYDPKEIFSPRNKGASVESKNSLSSLRRGVTSASSDHRNKRQPVEGPSLAMHEQQLLAGVKAAAEKKASW